MTSLIQFVKRVFLSVWFCSLPLLVWAREGEAAESYTPPSWSQYMLCYALVVLLLGLGMLVVCHPVHRRDKPLKKDEE